MIEDSILVVDDDPTIRQLFHSFFTGVEYNVYSAETAEEALTVLEQKYFQLIFIDINLPGMSGIELCNKIREHNPIATIVAITGYGPIYNSEECKAAGFDYYFKKPLRLEKLLKIAEKVFTNHE